MNSNAANRLDRLPIASIPQGRLWRPSPSPTSSNSRTSTASSVTAPKLIKLWGVTVNQVAYVTSLSFVGMFFGSVIASWLADRWGRKKALDLTTM